MVFSSITFLYYFLPIILLIYFLVPNKIRNYVLLLGSLFFYFYGEPRYILILIFSIIFNFYIGKYIFKNRETKKGKPALIISILVNFGLLFYFKYFNFFIENINTLLNSSFSSFSIVMPIGISFFTFQATSYVIDIYKGKIKASGNIFSFATYLSLFPQLIAGPIVRYETIESELEERKTNFNSFYNGVRRFVFGLSKKVLIANVLGELSKSLVNMSSITILSSWTKAIADTLQIYFDFSGYSDMAIGLGLMFGFHFLENFNYPFISTSITEFWHRWHISLSSWFKDYVYIPLGGSRKGTLRRYLNIFMVWMLTGFWHGASWNFIIWGLYFAFLLIIEKMFLYNFLKKHKLTGLFYTLFLVIISFVIFNQTTVLDILTSLSYMFGFNNVPFSNVETIYYLRNYLVLLIVAVILSTPLLKILIKRLCKFKNINKIVNALEPFVYVFLIILCTAFIVDESFNPFLYFRF